MKLYIRNMVCNRCKYVVKTELEKLGEEVLDIDLGEVELKGEPNASQLELISKVLAGFGFALINDKASRTIEAIKTTIIEAVKDPELLEQKNLSDILTTKLNRDYSSLSKLFSEVEGITLEQFFILQKIERAKEMLVYDEMSLTEISYELGYSSVAHLSSQFRKVTGLTPSHFRKLRVKPRKSLDDLI